MDLTDLYLRTIGWMRTGEASGLLLYEYEDDDDDLIGVLETVAEPPERLYGPGPLDGAFEVAENEYGVQAWLPAPYKEVGDYLGDWVALRAWTRHFISLSGPYPVRDLVPLAGTSLGPWA